MSTASKVLISGASVAGPALAWWLARYGFDVTIVEKAPALRPGGQEVDFKGTTQLGVLEQMGLLEAVRAGATDTHDGAIVDASGRRIGVVPAAFSGGDLEIPRGDLSHLLYENSRSSCDYVFAESITSLVETDDGVCATFYDAPARTFDLVVGADGIHSNVRGLAFGPEADHVRHLGYYYAQADLGDGVDAGSNLLYGEPGRTIVTGGTKAPAFFVFACPEAGHGRDDVAQQKQLLADAYRGGGWRTAELIEQVASSEVFYLDAIARATVDRYANGRVVLLGDAAWGNTLGGFGTGLAVVGAYVLAGELAVAAGEHRRALARYEEVMRGYAKVARAVNAGRLLAPRTRWGMRARNALFSAAFLFTPLMRLSDRLANDVQLLDYPAQLNASR